MLTKIRIQNFKGFEDVEIELGQTVVLVGPNNSGKTTALQALALWKVGVKLGVENGRFNGRKNDNTGMILSRRDLLEIPIPAANLLWQNLIIRNGKKNRRIEISVWGTSNGVDWQIKVELAYSNPEILNCYINLDENSDRDIVEFFVMHGLELAFLPPMSGLIANELRVDPGAINVRLGEGRTAEVLRNLCYYLYEETEIYGSNPYWNKIVELIWTLFNIELQDPYYDSSRGEITMSYIKNDISFDISTSGRGQLQTLLLLAFLYSNPGSIILLDEPDAHLEIIRQREIYRLIKTVVAETNSQLIIASHSEVILNEAIDDGLVIGFVGKPHRLATSGDLAQVRKSLNRIPAEDYLQAEETGWVLYLEGSTDLSILQKFALKLNHSAKNYLSNCFVRYIGNQFSQAQDHFFGLHFSHRNLKAIVILDHPKGPLPKGDNSNLQALFWKRNEIENYFTSEKVLLEFAK
ncbi:MAG: AAA family ATPase, partial [Candidatus Pacebacteria bacterium]|nr:AAA family ATPase [Candidatus Paceibacterota bacterium]